MNCISVSLVTYHPDVPMLRDTLASLRIAAAHALEEGGLDGVSLTIVDNGDDPGLDVMAAEAGWADVKVVSGQGNVGFGSGHNLALPDKHSAFHLILNPDVYLQADSLMEAIRFMRAQPACVLLSPAIVGEEAGWHYLCKRYPSVFDLFLRGFAPRFGARFFARRLAHYEMQDVARESVLWDPLIVSGCFMLFRSEVLRRLGGFDPRYFLYFEDFDLSLRAAREGRLAAVGAVRIAHFGGGAGRKGWKHVRMFMASARTFFQTHGWKLF